MTGRPQGERRRLLPPLGRDARLVLGGDVLSAVGTGMTLPFLLVYLSEVRGIDLEVAGLAAATVAFAGFVGNPLGGWLSDHVGARNALIGGLVTSALGTAAVALVARPWQAFAATALMGLGAAVTWPAQDALLAVTVPAAHRSSVFSLRFATMNAGFGLGGLLAAAIVDLNDPATFVAVYLVDSVSFLAFVPILFLLPPGSRASAVQPGEHPASGGFRAVLRDRVFVRVWLLTAVVVSISYGQFHTSLPVYATTVGGLTPGALGVAYAANTLTIVAAQLLLLRLLDGRRRTTALALACGTWAVTWLLAALAGEAGGGVGGLLAFVVVLVVFALAETMLSPTLAPIVNDLASDELRGRYNGVATLAWTTGFMAGPVVGTFVLGSGAGRALFLGLAGACGLAAVASVRMGRYLPVGANRIGHAEDEVLLSPVPAGDVS